MLFNRRSKSIRKRHSAWLYSVVFEGAVSSFFIFILCTSFLIQPFHKALANEPTEEVPPPTPVAEDVAPQIEEPPPEVTTETAIEEQSPTEVPSDGVSSDVPETEPQTEDVSEPEVADSSPDDSSGDVPLDESATSTSETNEGDQEETASTSDGVPTEPAASSTVIHVEGLVNEQNFYQFSKQSCVLVGDGAYHCSNKTDDEVDTQSVVYAERGESGNLEIFLKTQRGKVKQITENSYDDTAPHYDPESMRIVWHRLVDGRYQIILYDIMEDSELQLTFSKTNNMEPKVSDAGIVWQAWDNNDWEIMYFDGTYTEQLTDNDSQDVAPVVQDGYVLWNVLGGEEQQARVYSIDTKETTSILGYEGGSIINPRFVLVYDTEYENGDIITQSFDPATGLSQPIAAKAAPEPINIPENDPTGEIRALLTQGKNQKEDSEVLDVGGDGGAEPIATTTPGTLDLKQSGDVDVPVIQAPPVDENFELTEYDLVIPENALNDALSNTQE